MTLVKSPSQIKSIIQVLSNYYKNKENPDVVYSVSFPDSIDNRCDRDLIDFLVNNYFERKELECEK